MKLKHFGAAAAAALALSCAYYVYADAGSAIDNWGPYFCPKCQLGTPRPDPSTKAYIEVMELKNYSGVASSLWKAAGDSYTICTASACISYKRSDNGDFIGRPAIDQKFPGKGGAAPSPNPAQGSGGPGPGPSAKPDWIPCAFGSGTVLVPPGGCDF